MIYFTVALQLAAMGTLSELPLVRRPNEHVTYYVVPDKLSNVTHRPPLDCHGLIESVLAEPVFVPEGTTVRPACSGRQTLVRIAANTSSNPMEAALDTVHDSLATPCSVLVFNSNVDMQGPFEFTCNENPPGYLGSTLTAWVANENSSIAMKDVRAAVYIGSETQQKIKAISLMGITNVFLDHVTAHNISIDGSVTEYKPAEVNGPFDIIKIYQSQPCENHNIAFKVFLGVSMVLNVGLLAVIFHFHEKK